MRVFVLLHFCRRFSSLFLQYLCSNVMCSNVTEAQLFLFGSNSIVSLIFENMINWIHRVLWPVLFFR